MTKKRPMTVEELEKRLAAAESEINRLTEEKNALAHAFDSLPELVFIKDDANNLLYANKKYREVLCLSDNEYIQKNLFDIIPPDHARKFFERDMDVIKKRTAITHDEIIELYGNRIILRISKTFFVTQNGQKCILGIASDITEIIKKRLHSDAQISQLWKDVGVAYPMVSFAVCSKKLIHWSNRFGELFSIDNELPVFIHDLPAFDRAIKPFLKAIKKNVPVIAERVVLDGEYGNDEYLLFAQPVVGSKPGQVIILFIPAGTTACNEKQNEIYGHILKSMQGIVYRMEYDEDLTITFISGNVKGITGYGHKILCPGKSFTQLIHEDDRERVCNVIHNAYIKHKKRYQVIFKSTHRDGSDIWLYDRGAFFEFAGKVFCEGLIVDITHQYRSRQKLYTARRRMHEYEMLFNRSASIIIRWKLNGRLKVDYISDNISRFGYTPEDFYTTFEGDYSIIHPGDEERVFAEAKDFSIVERTDYIQEYRILTKDGATRWVIDQTWAVKDPHGTIINWYSILIDITEAKENELAFAEERERLRVTIRAIADGVVATDILGTIVLCNDVAKDLFALTESPEGHVFSDYFHARNALSGEETPNVIKEILSGQGPTSVRPVVLTDIHGNRKFVEYSASPIINDSKKIVGVVVVIRDVTLRNKLEAEAQKAEKLESIGVLAGGIAHDFNNILTAIYGNISLAKLHVADNEKAVQLLDSAERASGHAKNLAGQLLTFAKGGAPFKRIGNFGKTLIESVTFIMRGSNIKTIFHVSDDLWAADYDDNQLAQVIGNLVLNAKQSMHNNGVLTVTATNCSGENRPENALFDHYIRVSIKDNGCGIKKEDLEKIFDPYFTTKENGSGLGLTTSFSIIKKHDGFFTINSLPGDGTECVFYLPAITDAVVPEPIPKQPLAVGIDLGVVLVMDDEPLVREAAGEFFKYLGYMVLYASEGTEAIDILSISDQKIDITVLDITIPGGLGGKEIIQSIRRLFPTVYTIVSSGYSDDKVIASYSEYGFHNVLKKPYTIADVGDVLDSYKAWRSNK